MIRNSNGKPAGVPNRTHGGVPVTRDTDGNAVGHRLAGNRRNGPRCLEGSGDRIASFGLDRDHLGQAINQAEQVKLDKPLPEAADDVPIAYGNENLVRALPSELLDDFKGTGLLTLAGERVVAGVAVIPAVFSSRLETKIKRLIVRSIHRNHVRTKDQQLRNFCDRRCFRNEDNRLHARSSRQAR